MVLDYKTIYCPSVSDYVSDGRTGHKRQRVRPIRKESWQSSEICDQCHSATFIKEWEWYQAYFLERISHKGAIKHKETIIMSRHLNYEHIEKLKNPSENKRRYINQLFYDPTLSKTRKTTIKRDRRCKILQILVPTIVYRFRNESNQPQCSHICVTYLYENCLLDIQEAFSWGA